MTINRSGGTRKFKARIRQRARGAQVRVWVIRQLLGPPKAPFSRRLTRERTPRKAVASPASTATENDAVRARDPDRAAPRSPNGVEVEPEGADVIVG